MATMCGTSNDTKLRAISVMISGDAFIHDTSNIKQWNICDDDINALKQWYNKSD